MKRIVSIVLMIILMLTTCLPGIATVYGAQVNIVSTGASDSFTSTAECISVFDQIIDNIFYKIDGTPCRLSDDEFRSDVLIGSRPYYLQGGCSVGEDIFIAATYETSTTKTLLDPDGYILKYKASEDRWYISEKLPVYHCNSLSYNPKLGAIVASNCYVKSQIAVLIDPDTLKLKTDTYSSGMVTVYSNSAKTGTVSFNALAYDQKNDRYFISGSGGHYIVNSSFIAEKTWTHSQYNNVAITGWVTQGVCVDENYVYLPYSEESTMTKNRLIIRDWNDTKICEVSIPIAAEIEDVFCMGNQYYGIFVVTGGSHPNYKLYKLNFKNSTVSYNANGGTGTMAAQTLLQSENSKIAKNSFTKSGCTFDGWAVSKSNGQKLYTNGVVNEWYTEGTQPNGYELCIIADGAVFDWYSAGSDAYTLTAQWKAYGSDYFTITYNVNKDDTNSSSGSMSVTYAPIGEKLYLPANKFLYNRHHFVGWTAESDGKWLYKTPTGMQWYSETDAIATTGGYEKYVFDDGERALIPADSGQKINFYAQWDKSTFTIKFMSDGAKGFVNDLIVKNGTSTALRKCTYMRSGYKCTGWTAYKPDSNTWFYGNNNGGWMTESAAEAKGLTATDKNVYKETQKVADTSWIDGETVYFYPQWTAITFTVRYNRNGGSGELASTTHTYGVSSKTANGTSAFTRSGYTLTGFKAHRQSDNAWLYHNPTTNTNKWVKEGWLIPSGYTEYKVYSKSGSNISATTGVDGDIVTFYALWTKDTGTTEKFTVRYHPNGGEGAMDETIVAIGTGKKLTVNTFTKEGYTFKGWNAYRTGLEAYGNSWLFWNMKADGTYAGGSYVDQWVPIGTQPTKSGITGIRLYNDNEKVVSTGVEGQVVSFYAQWNPISYNLQFAANGGTGSMGTQSVAYGIPEDLSANQFRTSTKKFNGWTALRNSDNTYYCVNKYDSSDKQWLTESDMGVYYEKYIFTDCEGVDRLSATSGDKITFTAQWKLWGDTAKDGNITITDAVAIQKRIAKIIEFDDEQQLIADVNNDGKVNIRDALCIQQYLAELIDAFPACQ